MEHSRSFDELTVHFIGNTLRRKVDGENFDKSIASRQNSPDFSPVKVLRYTGWYSKPKLSFEEQMEALLQEHKVVFQEELGQIKFETTLQLKPTATSKFCKARSVPFALQAAIGRDLDRLEGKGILERVPYSQWAAPIVSVPKHEGIIRMCGDYKVTINPQLEVDQYPLPKPDTIFSTLSEGKWFSKIDLTHAYQQLNQSQKNW